MAEKKKKLGTNFMDAIGRRLKGAIDKFIPEDKQADAVRAFEQNTQALQQLQALNAFMPLNTLPAVSNFQDGLGKVEASVIDAISDRLNVDRRVLQAAVTSAQLGAGGAKALYGKRFSNQRAALKAIGQEKDVAAEKLDDGSWKLVPSTAARSNKVEVKTKTDGLGSERRDVGERIVTRGRATYNERDIPTPQKRFEFDPIGDRLDPKPKDPSNYANEYMARKSFEEMGGVEQTAREARGAIKNFIDRPLDDLARDAGLTTSRGGGAPGRPGVLKSAPILKDIYEGVGRERARAQAVVDYLNEHYRPSNPQTGLGPGRRPSDRAVRPVFGRPANLPDNSVKDARPVSLKQSAKATEEINRLEAKRQTAERIYDAIHGSKPGMYEAGDYRGPLVPDAPVELGRKPGQKIRNRLNPSTPSSYSPSKIERPSERQTEFVSDPRSPKQRAQAKAVLDGTAKPRTAEEIEAMNRIRARRKARRGR